jgi:hypothetical protein
LNSRLIAPESREVKLNLSKWDPAVSKNITVWTGKITPIYFFKNSEIHLLFLRNGRHCSSEGRTLDTESGNPRFIFSSVADKFVWIWMHCLISLASRLLLYK